MTKFRILLKSAVWLIALTVGIQLSSPAHAQTPPSPRTLLLVRVYDPNQNPPGAPISGYGTPLTEQLAQAHIDQLNLFLQDDSYGIEPGVITTITPPLPLPQPLSSYPDPSAIINVAAGAASSAGYQLSNYEKFVVTSTFRPGWPAGTTTLFGSIHLNGNWSEIGGIPGIGGVRTLIHEYIHSLGSGNHANSYNASNDKQTPGLGQAIGLERGNPYSIMGTHSGNNPLKQGIDYHTKRQLGWLTASQIHTVVSPSETIFLAAVDDGRPSANVRGIQLYKSNTYQEYYGFELRTDPPQGNKKGILTYNVFLPNGYALLRDTDIETDGGLAVDNKDAAIEPGETFYDPFTQTSLTVAELHEQSGGTADYAEVLINKGPFPNNNPPAVTMTASQSVINVGQTVTFTAVASDPDPNDELYYHWRFGDGGTSLKQPSQGGRSLNTVTHSWNYQNFQNTNLLVEVTVSDGKDGIAVAQTVLAIGNPPGHSVTGSVLTIAGQGVPGVMVKSGNYKARTDSNGQFQILNIPPGTQLHLEAKKWGLSVQDPGWVTINNSMALSPLLAEPIIETIGPGTNIAGGPYPKLKLSAPPYVGNGAFELQVTEAAPQSTVYFLLGTASGTTPWAWGTIYVNFAQPYVFFEKTADSNGRAALNLPIPNSLIYWGASWFLQAVVYDGQNSAVTNALKIRTYQPALGSF